VPQHKRMAMGEKIDGTSMGSKTSAPQKKQSGLSHVVNKKNK